jgi:hypothetical protein
MCSPAFPLQLALANIPPVTTCSLRLRIFPLLLPAACACKYSPSHYLQLALADVLLHPRHLGGNGHRPLPHQGHRALAVQADLGLQHSMHSVAQHSTAQHSTAQVNGVRRGGASKGAGGGGAWCGGMASGGRTQHKQPLYVAAMPAKSWCYGPAGCMPGLLLLPWPLVITSQGSMVPVPHSATAFLDYRRCSHARHPISSHLLPAAASQPTTHADAVPWPLSRTEAPKRGAAALALPSAPFPWQPRPAACRPCLPCHPPQRCLRGRALQRSRSGCCASLCLLGLLRLSCCSAGWGAARQPRPGCRPASEAPPVPGPPASASLPAWTGAQLWPQPQRPAGAAQQWVVSILCGVHVRAVPSDWPGERHAAACCR